MNNNFLMVIIIVNFILTIYVLYKINKMEQFTSAPTTQSLQDQIKAIYQADIQAIRNLSAIAASLQAGGLTVPGNLTNTGDFTAAKAVNCNSLNITNAGGQITGANGNSLVIPQNAIIRKNLELAGAVVNSPFNVNTATTINNNLNVTGSIQCGNVSINSNGIYIKKDGVLNAYLDYNGNAQIKGTLSVNNCNPDVINLSNAGGSITGSNGNAIRMNSILLLNQGGKMMTLAPNDDWHGAASTISATGGFKILTNNRVNCLNVRGGGDTGGC